MRAVRCHPHCVSVWWLVGQDANSETFFWCHLWEASHQLLFSISPGNSRELELVQRRAGRTEVVPWPPQAALTSENLGNILPSWVETRELKAPKEAKIPAPIAFP